MNIGKPKKDIVTHIVNEIIWDMVLDSVDDNISNEIWELCILTSVVLHKILYEYEYR
jgi:hypothetical protein